jgi:hypothetical protein
MYNGERPSLGLIATTREKRMSRTEYERFMQHLYDRYVRSTPSHRFSSREYEEFQYGRERLHLANRRIRSIFDSTRDDNDIYRYFKEQGLADTVDQVREGVASVNRFGEELGMWEAIDEFYDEILADLDVNDMPTIERQVLRDVGAPDPDSELVVIVAIVKKRRGELFHFRSEQRLAKRLDSLREDLERHRNEMHLQDNAEPKRKSRRWFKGLGQIAQGAAMTTANLALAIGLLPFSVAPETTTWGALVSSITGVGYILNGAGELSSE